MIKSDFGTIEVDGREPVIMAEFETLLVALRRVLGEELSEDGKEILRKGEKERLVEALKTFLSEMEDK